MNLRIPAIPGLRRDLLAMAILAASATLAVGILNPIMPIYLDSIGVDAQTIGLLASVFAFAIGIGEFSWGWAADRVHCRLPMAIGTVGLALVLFSFTLTQAVPVLFLLFFLRGGTLAAIFPSSRGFIGCTMPIHQKGLFLAIFSTILGFSNSLGALVGGYTVRELGYVAAFLIAGTLATAGGIVGLFMLRARRLTQYAADVTPIDEGNVSVDRPKLTEAARLDIQVLLAMLSFTSIGVISTFVPLLAKKVLFLQPADVGVIFSVSALFSMALPIPMGRLSDRFGRRALMVAGLALAAFAVAEIAYADSFTALLIFVSLRQVGQAAFQPAAVALFSDTAPSGKQGAAMGIYGMCEDLGIIVGPGIGGFVWESLGPQSTFLLAAIPTAAASIISLLAVKRRRQLRVTS